MNKKKKIYVFGGASALVLATGLSISIVPKQPETAPAHTMPKEYIELMTQFGLSPDQYCTSMDEMWQQLIKAAGRKGGGR